MNSLNGGIPLLTRDYSNMTNINGQFNNVYLLGPDFTSKNNMYCVKSEIKGFDEYRFYKGEWIKDWPKDIIFYCEGKKEVDLLLGGLHWLLASERMRQVFIQNDVQGIQFLKTEVVHNNTGKVLDPYWAPNVIQATESLHWENIQNLNIFRCHKTSIFVSEQLKRWLEKAGAIRGVVFTRMPHK